MSRYPLPRRREGFALPMAILAMALMTAAVIAAYSATSAETIANNAMRAQQRAQHLAETGLQQFLLRRGEPGFCSNCVSDPGAVDSEWTRVSLAGGYADVVAMRLRSGNYEFPSLFLVRSRGTDTSVRLSGAGRSVYATRVVGQYATFGTAMRRPMAAFTSLNGVTNTAWSPPVDGRDACGYGDRTGLMLPTGSAYRGSGSAIINGTDSSISMDTLKSRVSVDWDGIINANAIPADFTIPPDGNWPSMAMADPAYWPVIRIKKSFTIPTNGRGLIIADSNLTVNVDSWDGVILVGGRLTTGGSGEIRGEVVTGLNRLLPTGSSVTATDSLRASKQIQYDICKVYFTSERLKIYFAWGNTWVDNVPLW